MRAAAEWTSTIPDDAAVFFATDAGAAGPVAVLRGDPALARGDAPDARFDQPAGTIAAWQGDSGATRLISKRMDAPMFDALLEYIAGGNELPVGMSAFEATTETAQVFTTTCTVDEEAFTVEVITGPAVARIDYALSVDPGSISDDGQVVVVASTRGDVSDVPLRAVSADEWAQLITTQWPADEIKEAE